MMMIRSRTRRRQCECLLNVFQASRKTALITAIALFPHHWGLFVPLLRPLDLQWDRSWSPNTPKVPSSWCNYGFTVRMIETVGAIGEQWWQSFAGSQALKYRFNGPHLSNFERLEAQTNDFWSRVEGIAKWLSLKSSNTPQTLRWLDLYFKHVWMNLVAFGCILKIPTSPTLISNESNNMTFHWHSTTSQTTSWG